jgi:hypothetical protein
MASNANIVRWSIFDHDDDDDRTAPRREPMGGRGWAALPPLSTRIILFYRTNIMKDVIIPISGCPPKDSSPPTFRGDHDQKIRMRPPK